MNNNSIKIGFVSLGCSKNLIDTEVMLARLANAGYAITTDETEADVVIVNTCAFIESAKKEGIIAIKVLHGYGSHGKGGVIRKAFIPLLAQWKKSKFILDYFGGDKWNLFDEDAKRILLKDKSIYNDCDIANSNPGITIIELN